MTEEKADAIGAPAADRQDEPSGVGPAEGARSSRDGTRLSREDVVWAYRVLLDRDPESEEMVQNKLAAWRTMPNLRRDIVSSEEFLERNPPATSHTPAVVIAELPGSLRLFVHLSDLSIGLCIIRGQYEESEMAFVRSVVKPGQTVIDVGANIGLYSIVMGDLVGSSGRVFAFEPLFQNSDLLERSVTENRMGDRIVLRRVLVGETAGEAELIDLPLDRGSWNSGGAYLRRADEPVPAGHDLHRIAMTSLDSETLPGRVSFIKIDVEGAEPFVLRGAKKLLLEDRPTILCEMNPTQLIRVAGCSSSELIAEMECLGYHCRALEDGKLSPPIWRWGSEDVGSVAFLPGSPEEDRPKPSSTEG